MENNNIHYYELCFYGDEDTNSPKYDPEKATSFVIKTEIPPVINDQDALDILFGSKPKKWMDELRENLTCVMEVTEEEADFFDIDGLTKRITDEKGTYYTRDI